MLDGDTVEVFRDNRPVRIRLNGIDCPEKAQSFGMKAKELTSSLCFGKTVTVNDLGKDRYGRVIGELTVNGQDVNQEIVRNGLAWWYRKYAPHDRVLEKLEVEAKQEKRGLWKDENPTPPWDFRHSKKSKTRNF
ncbi:MAG: thermonuclease family protein [Candidatus Obscuribacterales bacterium]|nr:thermonuclease family protein [Candidatus Obscuribacterales bacterium]